MSSSEFCNDFIFDLTSFEDVSLVLVNFRHSFFDLLILLILRIEMIVVKLHLVLLEVVNFLAFLNLRRDAVALKESLQMFR